jgi:hypothetical protein
MTNEREQRAMYAVVQSIVSIINDGGVNHYEPADIAVRARFGDTFGSVAWEAVVSGSTQLTGVAGSALDALTMLEQRANGWQAAARKRRAVRG